MRRLLAAACSTALVLALGIGVASAQTKITFWTMSLSPTFNDYLEGLVDRFESQHPDVTVNWQDIPASTLREQYLAAVASGDVPDVVNFPSAWTRAMAQRGSLYDIDELISPEEQSRYFRGIMNATLWNGKTWALPWYVTPDMLFVNAAVFDQAGLSVDNPPETWDEAIEYARIIQDETGMYGFSPNFLLADIFRRNGIALLDENGNVGFDTPQAVALVEKWVDVYNDGLVPPDVVTNVREAELDAVQRYEAGRLGMLITGPQFVSRIADEAPGVYASTVAVPLPVGSAGTSRASVQTIAISKGSEAPEAAADLALFVTNAENQLAFDKLVTIFPSVKAAAADPFFSKGGDTPEDVARKIAAEDLRKIDATPTDLPDQARMIKALDDAITNAMLGVKTPQEAVDDAAAFWQSIIDNE